MYISMDTVAVYITFYFLQTLSGRSISKFQGHFSIIYDLCWSYNDKELLSASSDGTARYSISKMSNGRVSLGVEFWLVSRARVLRQSTH